MSPPPKAFPEFVQWLRTRSQELTELGALVEFQFNDAPSASVRLRIERGRRLGELTVWNDGLAHLAILELSSGDFIHERDGLPLAEEALTRELDEFFARLTSEE